MGLDNFITINTPCLFKEDKAFNDPLLMRVRIAVAHSGLNRNKSYIKKEELEKAGSTLVNIPILGDMVENKDGELDFSGHTMEIIEDEFHEGEERYNYIEKVIGIIPETNELSFELDEETGNYYIWVTGYIFREYGNYAADIVESRENEVEVSCELWADNTSFNAKGGYLELGDITFTGVTLLGKDVGAGMAKAHAQVFTNNREEIEKQMTIIMQELTKALNNYTQAMNFAKTRKGGKEENMKLEELLAKYNVEKENLTFEVEGLSDEDLEQKFAENFKTDFDENGNKSEDNSSDEEKSDEGETDQDNSNEDKNSSAKNSEENSEGDSFSNEEVGEEQKFTKTFELSHDDIRAALYKLISQYEELDNTYYYISAVYDNRFVMEDCCTNMIYGQNYTKDGDNIVLDGERYRLYREYVTESQKAELDSMRSNYSALVQFKSDYDKSQKENLFADAAYNKVSETEEFKGLISESAELTFEECENRANAILGKFSKATFAAQSKEKKPNRVVYGLNISEETNNSLYGDFIKKK